jgi:hypothetical protein
MHTEETAWERLAAFVRDRRVDLGMTQDEAAARAGKGMNRTTWGKVERARLDAVSAKTEYAICRALKWTGDSVQRIHKGEDPIPIGGIISDATEMSTIEALESDPELDEWAREVVVTLYKCLVRYVEGRRQH